MTSTKGLCQLILSTATQSDADGAATAPLPAAAPTSPRRTPPSPPTSRSGHNAAGPIPWRPPRARPVGSRSCTALPRTCPRGEGGRRTKRQPERQPERLRTCSRDESGAAEEPVPVRRRQGRRRSAGAEPLCPLTRAEARSRRSGPGLAPRLGFASRRCSASRARRVHRASWLALLGRLQTKLGRASPPSHPAYIARAGNAGHQRQAQSRSGLLQVTQVVTDMDFGGRPFTV